MSKIFVNAFIVLLVTAMVATFTQQQLSAQMAHLTDTEVVGYKGIGDGIAASESYSFNTVRSKQKNLRIHFDDTLSTSAFPTNDWRIVLKNADGTTIRVVGKDDIGITVKRVDDSGSKSLVLNRDKITEISAGDWQIILPENFADQYTVSDKKIEIAKGEENVVTITLIEPADKSDTVAPLLPGDGKIPFTIEPTSNRNLVPGNRIDVLWTKNTSTSGSPAACRLLQNVKVLAVGKVKGLTNDSRNSVTLELAPKMDENLAYAQLYGKLTLSLRASVGKNTEPLEVTNLRSVMEKNRADEGGKTIRGETKMRDGNK